MQGTWEGSHEADEQQRKLQRRGFSVWLNRIARGRVTQLRAARAMHPITKLGRSRPIPSPERTKVFQR